MSKPIKPPLKPCPFCGCRARISTQPAPSCNGIGMEAHVSCGSTRCPVHPQASLAIYAGTLKEPQLGSLSNAWSDYLDKREQMRDEAWKKAVALVAKAWNKRKEPT